MTGGVGAGLSLKISPKTIEFEPSIMFGTGALSTGVIGNITLNMEEGKLETYIAQGSKYEGKLVVFGEKIADVSGKVETYRQTATFGLKDEKGEWALLNGSYKETTSDTVKAEANFTIGHIVASNEFEVDSALNSKQTVKIGLTGGKEIVENKADWSLTLKKEK